MEPVLDKPTQKPKFRHLLEYGLLSAIFPTVWTAFVVSDGTTCLNNLYIWSSFVNLIAAVRYKIDLPMNYSDIGWSPGPFVEALLVGLTWFLIGILIGLITSKPNRAITLWIMFQVVAFIVSWFMWFAQIFS